jgi:hypothetical protein
MLVPWKHFLCMASLFLHNWQRELNQAAMLNRQPKLVFFAHPLHNYSPFYFSAGELSDGCNAIFGILHQFLMLL